MTRRLSTLPLALLLAVPACDAPEGSCEADPEMEAEEAQEPVDLMVECGFARRYGTSQGSLDGELLLTHVYQSRDEPVWGMHGETRGGVFFGIEIHPRDCDGEFSGLWWGDAGRATIRFAGVITPDGVSFDDFVIGENTEAGRETYQGLRDLPVMYREYSDLEDDGE